MGVALEHRLVSARSPPRAPLARDEFVYWGFGAGGLTALAGLAGFAAARP
jgi:hypothetical protein